MKNVRFSDQAGADIEQAAELSRRLRPDEVHAHQPPEPGSGVITAFTGFRAANVRYGSPSTTEATPLPELPEGEPDLRPGEYGATSWEALLDWARGTLGAESAFLLDEQGLVVTVVGALDADGAGAIGARLLGALSQAELLAEAANVGPALSIDLQGRWISGFTVNNGEGTVLTIGLTNSKPLGTNERGLLERSLRKITASR